jgi:Flp pilus assembly protein TadG
MNFHGHKAQTRNLALRKSGRAREEKPSLRQRAKESGQIIAIFALMLTSLIGLVGIAIDVTFAWRDEMRIQRAADAAALAGVVYLPGDIAGGVNAATQEATKNGYTSSAKTVVNARQNPDDIRQMNVTITAQTPTFFVRLFGVDHFTVTREAKAVFILPVPMGSPDSYYGVFGSWKLRSGTTVQQLGPSGQTINARKLWGSMLTQGAATQNGDAYLPKRNIPGPSGTSPQHSSNYYDYAIEVPAGANATVYIFDPGYCAGDSGGTYGTGDKWFSGQNAVSAYYRLYNTNNQLYNPGAQTLVADSGNFFANQKASDTTIGGPTPSGSLLNCANSAVTNPTDPRYWHLRWWPMATVNGGAEGTTYRLRTTSDPGNTSQDGADACNQFSIYVETDAGTSQVYGLGAMQMYTPLPGGQTSEFYLAQIDQQSGAGKTIEISLWDPGDTNQRARLRILQPNAGGWSAVSTLNWTAQRITSAGSNCNGTYSGSYIETYSTSSNYNGCWLTIRIVLPSSYNAPQDGWWKISYEMLGAAGTNSTDETTWQVNIRGNPVHLIP